MGEVFPTFLTVPKQQLSISRYTIYQGKAYLFSPLCAFSIFLFVSLILGNRHIAML